jgi:hypothetical protein
LIGRDISVIGPGENLAGNALQRRTIQLECLLRPVLPFGNLRQAPHPLRAPELVPPLLGLRCVGRRLLNIQRCQVLLHKRSRVGNSPRRDQVVRAELVCTFSHPGEVVRHNPLKHFRGQQFTADPVLLLTVGGLEPRCWEPGRAVSSL